MDRMTIFASFPTMPLTDHLPHGDGLVAWHFLEALSLRGHRLHVITPRAELRRSFSGDVQVYEMNGSGNNPRPHALAYMFWSRQMLRRICRAERIDLIHELNPVLSLCSLAFVGSGVPVVLGPHSSRWQHVRAGGGSVTRLRRRVKSRLKDIVVSEQHKRASAILLSTAAALNNVRRPEEHAGRLYVLPPGLDTAEFSPGPQHREASPTILFLANVSARKGIFSLLEAFSLLVRQRPDVRLVIAGDGPDLPEVKRRIASSFYRAQVSFPGRIDRARVPELMRSSTVYCLPSHGEPFGMTVIEAMGCGKPVIVTRAGGPAWMVSDAGGRRVPPGDVQSLADALEEVLSQPELARTMGCQNRAEAESQYAWPVIAARLEDIYRRVLGAEQGAESDLVTLQQIAGYRLQESGGRSSGTPVSAALHARRMEAQL